MVRFGARKSIMIAYAGATIGFLLAAFAPNVQIVWVGFIFVGTIYAFGQGNAYAAVIRNWIAPEYQGRYLGLIGGVATLGSAIWPALGGQLFTKLGVSKGFLALIPCYLIPAIFVFFLVKGRPADVTPIGWSGTSERATTANGIGNTGKASAAFKFSKSKTFWIGALAMLVTVVLYSQLTLMATSFQMAGFSAGKAATISSIVNLLAFPVNIIAGQILDKKGARFLSSLSYGLVAVSAVCMTIFFNTGSILFLVLFALSNALCRPYVGIHVYVSGELFGENATLVQPRLYSFCSLGSIVITPLVSALAEQWGGYANLGPVWVACSILLIIIWRIAYRTSKKERGIA